jgi:hypothetical protein
MFQLIIESKLLERVRMMIILTNIVTAFGPFLGLRRKKAWFAGKLFPPRFDLSTSVKKKKLQGQLERNFFKTQPPIESNEESNYAC